jgi:hypothetical protein
MIEQLFTKQNLALLGVLALFLWRIIDLIIRQKNKRETELQRLAFEMVKYRFGEDVDPFTREAILQYYFFYLDALEHNLIFYDRGIFKVMKEFDGKLSQKIERLKEINDKLEAIENKLSQHHNVSTSDLWDRHFNWSLWFRETKKLLNKTFSRKTNFR